MNVAKVRFFIHVATYTCGSSAHSMTLDPCTEVEKMHNILT